LFLDNRPKRKREHTFPDRGETQEKIDYFDGFEWCLDGARKLDWNIHLIG